MLQKAEPQIADKEYFIIKPGKVICDDVKRLWIERLLSGKYVQIRGFAYSSNPIERCAFGVMLKEPISTRQGVDTRIAHIVGTIEANDIININDKYGKSFKEIAEWINDNL